MNGTSLAIIQPEELETIQRKRCCQCEKTKAITDFPRNRTRPDGYEYRCKLCARIKHQEWKEANRDKWRESKRKQYWSNPERERTRARQQREKNPKPLLSHNQTYNRNHPNRMDAVNAVNRAVVAGTLPHINTQRCKQCDKQAQNYHHHSYEPESWLDVIPLCRSCHRLIHTAAKRQEKQ